MCIYSLHAFGYMYAVQPLHKADSYIIEELGLGLGLGLKLLLLYLSSLAETRAPGSAERLFFKCNS